MRSNKEIEEFVDRCKVIVREIAEDFRPEQMKDMAKILKTFNHFFVCNKTGEVRLTFDNGEVLEIEEVSRKSKKGDCFI